MHFAIIFIILIHFVCPKDPEMNKTNYLLPLFLSAFVNLNTAAQKKESYPDSLKGIVLKIEPLSFLYNHLSAGIEAPLGKAFLDINVGVSDVGLTDYADRKGGFLTKVGVKFPLNMHSPFSILYLMPEVAYSHFKAHDYSTTTSIGELKTVNSKAIMLCFGYRHLNPASRFYYDGGIDLGYGWSNLGGVSNNYNFNISNTNDSYSPTYTTPTSTSGVALSCHFAVGLLLKSRSKK